MDQLPAPIFIPMKTGVDVETQIYDGELFDFDAEVDPILEVLVGKTLEQSMMEVLEEEELSSIRRRQAMFEQMRQAELLEVQRMEAAEKRREEERLRAAMDEEKRREREAEAARRRAAEQLKQLQAGGEATAVQLDRAHARSRVAAEPELSEEGPVGRLVQGLLNLFAAQASNELIPSDSSNCGCM